MAAEKVRLNLQLSADLNNILEEIAEAGTTTKTEVIRQALALMRVAHRVKNEGKHLGITSDPNRLDTEIIGVI